MVSKPKVAKPGQNRENDYGPFLTTNRGSASTAIRFWSREPKATPA